MAGLCLITPNLILSQFWLQRYPFWANSDSSTSNSNWCHSGPTLIPARVLISDSSLIGAGNMFSEETLSHGPCSTAALMGGGGSKCYWRGQAHRVPQCYQYHTTVSEEMDSNLVLNLDPKIQPNTILSPFLFQSTSFQGQLQYPQFQAMPFRANFDSS